MRAALEDFRPLEMLLHADRAERFLREGSSTMKRCLGNGGSWNKDGVILVATSAAGGLQRVSASGGTPVPVTTLDTSRKEVSQWSTRRRLPSRCCCTGRRA